VQRDEILEIVERYRAGWFAHDVDTIMSVLTDDVVFDNLTAGERVEGAEAVRAHVAGIHASRPDLSFTERAVYVGDDVAVIEWTAAATDSAGARSEWDGIDVINVRDGLIARNAVYSSSRTPRAAG
jgi:uncharacterized protein (TIGR02246 family)